MGKMSVVQEIELLIGIQGDEEKSAKETEGATSEARGKLRSCHVLEAT